MPLKKIVFVLGEICSGKTTFIKTHLSEYTRVSVSDHVKQIMLAQKQEGTITRSILQDSCLLEISILRSILNGLSIEENNNIAIDGIRQWSIIEGIISYYNIHHHSNYVIDFWWLNVDRSILKERYNSDQQKNDISFEEALENDYKLGLGTINEKIFEDEQYVKYTTVLSFTENNNWEVISYDAD